MRFALAAFLLAFLSSVLASDLIGDGTNAPWVCMAPDGVTVLSSHAQQYRASAECGKRADGTHTDCSDGYTQCGENHFVRRVGAIRVERLVPECPDCPVEPPDTLARLTWTAPTTRTDGGPILNPLSYIVLPDGLETVDTTALVMAPGCWTVRAVEGGRISDSSNQVCK